MCCNSLRVCFTGPRPYFFFARAADVDDWMFVKDDNRYDEIRQRLHDFRERTRKYWQYEDGTDRSTWMTPMTTYDNSTDLRNRTTAQGYFPDYSLFERLQRLKAEVDPTDLFSNTGTIPLPGTMYGDDKQQ